MGVAIPRVEAHCRYLSPCTFSQEVEVELWVEELRDRSLRYGFRIHNRSEGKVAAEGWVTVVSIDISRFEAVRMPEELRRALTPYLREG
jgi:acyl-CoA thioesterase FadM